MHIFGEKVYVHIPKEKSRAPDAKARKGYFIGYGEETKGYRVWYLDNNKIDIARDVIFTGRLNETITQIDNNNEKAWVNEENNNTSGSENSVVIIRSGHNLNLNLNHQLMKMSQN